MNMTRTLHFEASDEKTAIEWAKDAAKTENPKIVHISSNKGAPLGPDMERPTEWVVKIEE